MVRLLRSFALFGMFLHLWAAFALATPRMSLEVHPNFGTLDDVFIFSVNIEDGAADTGPPLLTGGKDFDLSLIGPSSSIKIINGIMNRSDTYNYQLSPKREGILDTPTAEITINGKKLSAAALQVTVKGARSTTPPDQTEPGNKDYFLRQSISPQRRVFVGQQITHTLEIFTRSTLLDPQLGNLTFQNFRSEPIGEQENSRRFLNSVPYAVSTLRRALFPEISGSLEVAPRELKAKVRAQVSARGFPFDFETTDPFDPNFIDNFFSRGVMKAITLRSNQLSVQVEPLPAPPADLPLLGLSAPPVGDVAIKSSYDGSALDFGGTKTITITVSSNGNIQALRSLGLKSSPSAKIYEESPQAKTTVQGDTLWTTKTFKLSVVPVSGSAVDLPPIQLGYFNPESGQFAVASSEPIRFEVTGAPPAPQSHEPPEQNTEPPAAIASPLPPSETSSDTSAAVQSAGLRYKEAGVIESLVALVSLPLALLLLTAALLLGTALFVGLRLRARGEPRRLLASALEDAQSAETIGTLLRSAIARAYPVLSANFSREELRREIQNKQLLYQIEALLDLLDGTLFGGQAASPDDLKARTRQILDAL
ncbi:MAG: hypothetical protein EBZ48_02665 [Proteobacteria bacterium]|nr:hypothetical protein [Pseudomonadota bacterium]